MTKDQRGCYAFCFLVALLVCLALQFFTAFPWWLCWAPLWVPLATGWWVLATRCIAEGFSTEEKKSVTTVHMPAKFPKLHVELTEKDDGEGEEWKTGKGKEEDL